MIGLPLQRIPVSNLSIFQIKLFPKLKNETKGIVLRYRTLTMTRRHEQTTSLASVVCYSHTSTRKQTLERTESRDRQLTQTAVYNVQTQKTIQLYRREVSSFPNYHWFCILFIIVMQNFCKSMEVKRLLLIRKLSYWAPNGLIGWGQPASHHQPHPIMKSDSLLANHLLDDNHKFNLEVNLKIIYMFKKEVINLAEQWNLLNQQRY